MKSIILDDEEKEILDSYERGEWESVADLDTQVSRLKTYAQNTIKRDKRINIRISSRDLSQAQALAAREGIPYQTLLSSIVHKYVSGHLVEKEKA